MAAIVSKTKRLTVENEIGWDKKKTSARMATKTAVSLADFPFRED